MVALFSVTPDMILMDAKYAGSLSGSSLFSTLLKVPSWCVNARATVTLLVIRSCLSCAAANSSVDKVG